MNITIEVSTPEKAETIRAFAQAVETGSIEGIQYCGNGKPKNGMEFHAKKSYRRKPAPTYRPWTPEEAIGKVVRFKSGGDLRVIDAAAVNNALVGGIWRSYSAMLSDFTQLDGSPCGVLEGGES